MAILSKLGNFNSIGASELFKPPSYATGSLPAAASYTGYVCYDSTLAVLVTSNGTSWVSSTGASLTADDVYNNGWTVDVNDKDLIFRMSNVGYNMLIDANVTGTTAEALVIDAKHVTSTITDAIKITTSGATAVVTTALNVSDAGIATALSAGANDLSGTNWSITGATGAVACAGNVAVNTDKCVITGSDGSINVGPNTFTVAATGAIVGLSLTGLAASTLALASASNQNCTLAAGGTGTLGVGTTGTGAITLGNTAAHLAINGNTITFSTTGFVYSPTATTTNGFRIDGDTVTSGNVFQIDHDASLSGDALAIVDDGTTNFKVEQDGATTILGLAKGTAALTLTSGDIAVTSGDIAIAAGNFDLTGIADNADLIDITRHASATGGDALDINMGNAAVAGDAIDILFGSGAATGDAIVVDMGSNVAGGVLAATVAGARTDATIDITDTSTSNSPTIDINCDGIRTGNGLDITYGTAAATENAIDLNMGTNVAGMAISVNSAATGTSGEGSAFDASHSGNLAAGADLVRLHSTGSPSSTSNILAIEQDTGAGTAGAYGLYISCAGTNVEAINVAAGTCSFAELVTGLGGFTAGASGGTAGADVYMYGATNGAYVRWDQANDQMLFVGATDLELQTNVTLSIGTAAADGSLTGTGANVDLTLTNPMRIGTPGTNSCNFAANGDISLSGTAQPTKKIWIGKDSFNNISGATEGTVGAGQIKSWEMTDAATDVIGTTIMVPDDGTFGTGVDITCKVYWSSPALTLVGRWSGGYDAIIAGENCAVSGTNAWTAEDDTSSGTADYLNVTNGFEISGEHLAAGDMLFIKVQREGAHANDTLADVADFLGVELSYTVTKLTW